MVRNIEHIGHVQFRRSKKARHVNITVKPFSEVVVSVPEEVSFDQAGQVLTDNLDWVRREQAKMREVENRYTVFEMGKNYRFKDLEVCIRSRLERYVTEEEKRLFISILPDQLIEDAATQQYIRDQVEAMIRKLARKHLPARAQKLASQHDIPVQKISVRKSTTRWGSCSQDNNLSLSYFTYLLPDHLLDYVILHELAHVKVKDHSKAYWLHLESLVKEARKLDREVRGWVIGVV